MKPLSIPIDEYTTPSPHVVGPGTSVLDVMELMREHGIRHVPVVDDERPVGIIGALEIKGVGQAHDVDGLVAEDIMKSGLHAVRPGTPLGEVVFEMASHKLDAVLVCRRGRIVGIFTATDALNALVDVLRSEVA